VVLVVVLSGAGAPCRYELQMRYGSIGWSVGAVLGYSLAARGKKRVLALIGDGSFQMTAQVWPTSLGCDSAGL
jgi:pyruvate decarboxylase